MTKATWSGAVLFATGISFGACHSSESGPPVPIDDLPRLLADAVCSNIGPCCQQAGFPHDPAPCQATYEQVVRADIERRRALPNVVYDGDAARACLDAYTATVKACQSELAADSACRKLFVGTLQPGQACRDSLECIPGVSCTPAADGSLQCAGWQELHRKLGDSCSVTCTEKADGMGCSGTSDGTPPGQGNCYTNDGLYCDRMHVCATIPALGQACEVNTACGDDAFCDNAVCTAKRTSGLCGQLRDGCASTAYCDGNGMCRLKSTGGACVDEFECPSTDSCVGGTCRTRTIASVEVCRGTL